MAAFGRPVAPMRAGSRPGGLRLLASGPPAELGVVPFRSERRTRKGARLAVQAAARHEHGGAASTSGRPAQEAWKEEPESALLTTPAAPAAGLEAVEAVQSAASRRREARQRHQLTYKVAATGASLGVTALAICAVHYRFAWHMQNGGEVPVTEAICTILLVFGGVVGMEMWARWAHKALWHDFAPGWALHRSHHVPRVGPFEANDVFAVVNAVPAIALCAYGFLTPTILGGVCFGAGLGITLFGMMYMFVHDGLVHRRFPVGPLADVPYLKRVAAAHKLHHAERFGGVPWGLFLGPQELAAVGGRAHLDSMCRELEEGAEADLPKTD